LYFALVLWKNEIVNVIVNMNATTQSTLTNALQVYTKDMIVFSKLQL